MRSNKNKEAVKAMEKFSEWMLKIKNIHYANNKDMSLAYQKVYQANYN